MLLVTANIWRQEILIIILSTNISKLSLKLQYQRKLWRKFFCKRIIVESSNNGNGKGP